MKRTKGFTLIELLVVIAIIGILSSVVLASLNTARDKGSDSAVKSNLSGIRSQAEILYDTDGDYDRVCAANGQTQDPTVAAAIAASDQAVAGGTAPVCGRPASGAASNWAISAQLKSTDVFSNTNGGAASGVDYWCVDSAGASKVITTALTANQVACP